MVALLGHEAETHLRSRGRSRGPASRTGGPGGAASRWPCRPRGPPRSSCRRRPRPRTRRNPAGGGHQQLLGEVGGHEVDLVREVRLAQVLDAERRRLERWSCPRRCRRSSSADSPVTKASLPGVGRSRLQGVVEGHRTLGGAQRPAARAVPVSVPSGLTRQPAGAPPSKLSTCLGDRPSTTWKNAREGPFAPGARTSTVNGRPQVRLGVHPAAAATPPTDRRGQHRGPGRCRVTWPAALADSTVRLARPGASPMLVTLTLEGDGLAPGDGAVLASSRRRPRPARARRTRRRRPRQGRSSSVQTLPRPPPALL